MKRTADNVTDLELPQGSRPMLALDRTRRRAANPQPNLAAQPSDITPLQATAVPSPASSDPRHSDSTLAPSQPIASPPGLDSRSPVEQSMLQEELEKGRSEGRQEIQAKLHEAESELKELRRQLDSAKFKEAYDQGFREGGKRVYDMCKRDRETKANEDRLAFQKMCYEKDLAIRDQQLTMSSYQKELMARRRRIADLEQYVSQQLVQNISGQQILHAEARFNAQAQELAVEKSQSQLMRAELGNWQARWDTISADLEKWKSAISMKASQLDAYQLQHNNFSLELQESRDQVKELAAINSEVIGRWQASSRELKSKLNVLSSAFDSLKQLTMKLTKVAAERLAEIKLVKALNEELNDNSKQVADGKEEISALTIQNTELAKERDDLEETVAEQDKELQDLSAENDELIRKLRERDERGQRAIQNPENTPNQADKEQAEEIDNLPADLVPETAAANIELVRVMVERERESTTAENARREQRVTATLERMEETEQRRRQMLIDELEVKDAQLYDAQNTITELTERLFATSATQPTQSLPSAPSSTESPPAGSPSPAQPSPIPTQPPPTPAASSPQPHPRSWFRLVSVAATKFSPRRLVIILSIFLLALLSFYLHSASRISATEDINSGQVAFEAMHVPADPIFSRSEAEEERRRLVQIWAWRNWERNERIFRGEGPHERDEEYMPILGLDL